MSHAVQALRYLWASPNSLLGLLLALVPILFGASVHIVDGTLEVVGRRRGGRADRVPGFAGFSAITFGHVILGVDHASLARCRDHERIHVRQYERWGLLFLPLYCASSLLQALRGKDPYRDNCFEREAYANDRAELDADAPRRHAEGIRDCEQGRGPVGDSADADPRHRRR